MKKLLILIVGMLLLLPISYAAIEQFILTESIADNNVRLDPSIETTQQTVFEFGVEVATSRGTVGNFQRAYFEVNLTNITILLGGNPATLVQFRGVRGGNPDIGFLPIFEVNETWDSSTLTWDNQPCGTLSPLPSNVTACNINPESNVTFNVPFQNFTYNITNMFKKAIDSGRERLSFALISPEDNSGIKVNIASKDESNEALHWFLNITVDSDAPIVTIENPSPVNDSFLTTVTQIFNISVIEDFLDTITLDLNGTNQTGFVNDFGNFHSLSVNTMGEGLFTYQIHVNDTTGNTFVSELRQFTVDNTSPVITYTIPTPNNLTVLTNTVGDIDILGVNANLILANLTIFNVSNNFQIFQNVTSGLSQPSFTFENSLSEIFVVSTVARPNGDYRFRACFIDGVNIETCQEVIITLNLPLPPPIDFFATEGTTGILTRVAGVAISIMIVLALIASFPVVARLRGKRGAKK